MSERDGLIAALDGIVAEVTVDADRGAPRWATWTVVMSRDVDGPNAVLWAWDESGAVQIDGEPLHPGVQQLILGFRELTRREADGAPWGALVLRARSEADGTVRALPQFKFDADADPWTLRSAERGDIARRARHITTDSVKGGVVVARFDDDELHAADPRGDEDQSGGEASGSLGEYEPAVKDGLLRACESVTRQLSDESGEWRAWSAVANISADAAGTAMVDVDAWAYLDRGRAVEARVPRTVRSDLADVAAAVDAAGGEVMRAVMLQGVASSNGLTELRARFLYGDDADPWQLGDPLLGEMARPTV